MKPITFALALVLLAQPSPDWRYLGAFRLPAESSNGHSFDRGGTVLAFNPAGWDIG